MVTVDKILEFPSFKNISPFLCRVNLPLLPMTCEGNKFVMVSSFIIVVVTSKILESHTFLGSEHFKSVV